MQPQHALMLCPTTSELCIEAALDVRNLSGGERADIDKQAGHKAGELMTVTVAADSVRSSPGVLVLFSTVPDVAGCTRIIPITNRVGAQDARDLEAGLP